MGPGTNFVQTLPHSSPSNNGSHNLSVEPMICVFALYLSLQCGICEGQGPSWNSRPFIAALSYLTLLRHCELSVVFILSDFNATPHAVWLSPYKKKTQYQATSTALNATKWFNRTRSCKTSSSGAVLTGRTLKRALTHCREVAWIFLTQHLNAFS